MVSLGHGVVHSFAKDIEGMGAAKRRTLGAKALPNNKWGLKSRCKDAREVTMHCCPLHGALAHARAWERSEVGEDHVVEGPPVIQRKQSGSGSIDNLVAPNHNHANGWIRKGRLRLNQATWRAPNT